MIPEFPYSSVNSWSEGIISSPAIFSRAVKMKRGWIGQVVVGKKVVWESPDAYMDEGHAVGAAADHVAAKLEELFA